MVGCILFSTLEGGHRNGDPLPASKVCKVCKVCTWKTEAEQSDLFCPEMSVSTAQSTRKLRARSTPGP